MIYFDPIIYVCKMQVYQYNVALCMYNLYPPDPERGEE